MRKSIVAIIMAFAMALCFCVGCAALPKQEENTLGSEEQTSQEIKLLKSDMKISQDDMLSRIKAERLIENNGYSADDEITAIIRLEEESLAETYASEGLDRTYDSLAEYANSAKGRAQARRIEARQNELVRSYAAEGLITGVEYHYSTIVNAVAVTAKYGNFDTLGSASYVQGAYLSDTFNRPQATSGGTDASAIVNDVNVYETGIFDSSNVPYTGAGTAVAILDSGFDCSHSVFANQPKGELLLTRSAVEEKLSDTRAADFTSGLKLSDVWYSDKIPFTYDYADKDNDVFPYDSEHGTHVAGIIGGKDDEITGVAVDTQLVLMKVFPDLDDGASTDDILAALEDAVLLNVDAINMSLGSSCGFAREEDDDLLNDVYQSIDESGISLITAASNSYNSAFGGEQGNTNLVTNPDSGTVGSPSTYPVSLSVASVSGVKSKYLIANDSQVVFFTESSSLTGDENDFFGELYEQQELDPTKEYTFDYITIPGSGVRGSYLSLPEGAVQGKIALVRRGDNTFEEKALLAKNYGAIACIIYNNVDGDISMSMGKTEHIPTISVSQDVGMKLASQSEGTLTFSYENAAGPFMSDFSSWGPTPDLQLKPEITAHGGNIRSSVPGGGYDNISGTSMASPNLCGIVVLIRQYLREKFPDLTWKEISVMTNQMLMSTADIVRNEEGNPYSPRKQGAGLANLYNVVNTKAYLTVDGIDRSKIELGDDPTRKGEYTMTFNVKNISSDTVRYQLSVAGMTETVSSYDNDRIAEMGQMLGGNYQVAVSGDGSYTGGVVSVQPNGSAKVTVTYTLSQDDKDLIDSLFPYGMYVEGFVKLAAVDANGAAAAEEVDLNIPFLAFYGDWTQAPLFDKTYYEVESEAHDASIDDEDKLKADYYATTPYGSYYYNYIIPLGSYLYDIDTSMYDAIPAREDHIALSNILGTIDGFSTVYAGLLRNAKTMTYTITDKLTGEELWRYVDYNANKAYSLGGSPIPSFELLNVSTSSLGLINNHTYEFKMYGLLDYGDGGAAANARNTFAFDFVLDDEAPVIKSATYEKVYDRTLRKDRYYLNLTLYDNQYVMSVSPIAFTSTSTYAFLTENPIPVYSEKGTDNTVRIEITDYLNDIGYDQLITSALAFAVEDYALNQNIYICQLPGTRGDFAFTRDGSADGGSLSILSIYEDEVVDLTDYLHTGDATVDADKDYLKYLVWESSDSSIAVVEDGQVLGLKAGRVRITVTEQMDLKSASITINVRTRPDAQNTSSSSNEARAIRPLSSNHVGDIADESIRSLRFAYFDTVFAYSRAAQTSQIGETGSRIYISGLPVYSTSTSGTTVHQVALYPGEQFRLTYDLQPWYVADRYKLTYSSGSPNVVSVDQDGKVTALREGSATITLQVEGSNLSASLRVTVNSPFVIEDRMLVAYKGLGGEVVIPDDEGILYIGAYAFCLYTTDNSIVVSDEDYDANKIPASNTAITSVIIPDGVEEIQKYAFYNCTALESVTIPESVRFIREYAFYNDAALKEIDLSHAEVIGAHAFEGCELLTLDEADLGHTYAIGESAFENCVALAYVDLSALRNTGARAFRGCTALKQVKLTANTKLSEAMFVRSGLTSVDIYETVEVPSFCFAQCEDLASVTLHNDLVLVGEGAFCQNPALTQVTFMGAAESIGAQVFYDCGALESITLPDSAVALGESCFRDCSALKTLVFGANTRLARLDGALFTGTALTQFEVPDANTQYGVSSDGHLLLNGDGDAVLIAATGYSYGDYTIPAEYTAIGPSAFSGTDIEKLTIVGADTSIGDYAFAWCSALTEVIFPSGGDVTVGAHAFDGAAALTTLTNLASVSSAGDYAFARTGVRSAEVGANAVYGEGAFYQGALTSVTIGANASFGLGAFQSCTSLETVNMPQEGGVHFGPVCFAYDTSLLAIDLSKTDGEIERESFFGCTALTSADLTGVTEIGDYAFAECPNLALVTLTAVRTIGAGAFAQVSENGSGASFTSIILPNTLTSIGEGAFLGCGYLESVRIPDSVETLGARAFALCSSLTRVTLPSSVKTIGEETFLGCELLSQIDLGSVEEIGDYAFYSTLALSTADLSSVKTIGDYAFYNSAVGGQITANALTSVGDYAFVNATIASFTAPALAEIGYAAFMGNASLTEFTLSSALKSVGALAFNVCPSLGNFYFMQGGEKVSEGKINDYAQLIGGVLYTTTPEGKLMLTSVPGGKDIQTLTVAEGTELIALAAGNGNKNVTAIVLPDSLRLIGNFAFYGYTRLQSVEFRSVTAPVLETEYSTPFNLYQLNSSYYDLCQNTTSGLALIGLAETDPGYALLHNQFDLFGYELMYYTFIGLAGKNQPIKMILPANEALYGYDSIVYLAYFGDEAAAERSDYVARERELVLFLDYASQIADLTAVTMADETLINNAVAAMNALTQSGTDYGYTQETWDALRAKVTSAQAQLSALRIANSRKEVRDLQAVINTLPTEYTQSVYDLMKEVETRLAALTEDERLIMDLTNYNALVASYNESLGPGTTPGGDDPSTPAGGLPGWAIAVIAVGCVLVVAAAVTATVVLAKKKKSAKAENENKETK